ncbi:MAG: ion transporter, partial [Rhizobiaceae bacterium]|nr:ion transporter [Rhizobiaceae bacterium]
MTRHHESWRRRLYRSLDPSAWHKPGVSPLNRAIIVLILLAVATAVLQTEPTIRAGRELLFRRLEIVFAIAFLAEYVARLWIAAENQKYGPGWRGMLRYAVSLPALVDLLALLTLFMTVFGSEGAFLRLFRLVRIMMLAKFGRYSTALQSMWGAVHSRRYELLMSVGIAAMLVLISSSLLFLVEGGVQPDDFGSIPRAMWWSVVTLTTVGYGDVRPVTVLGRILAGMTAVSGLGLIAMPTGILAAAFSDAMQRQREEKEKRQAERAAHRLAEKTADIPETADMDYAGDKDWALERALSLLDTFPLVDAHNDLPYLIRYGPARGDIRSYGLDRLKPGAETDIPRMRQGRMAAQVWAAFIPAGNPDPARATLSQIELIRQLSDVYPETFRHTVAATEIAAA